GAATQESPEGATVPRHEDGLERLLHREHRAGRLLELSEASLRAVHEQEDGQTGRQPELEPRRRAIGRLAEVPGDRDARDADALAREPFGHELPPALLSGNAGLRPGALRPPAARLV